VPLLMGGAVLYGAFTVVNMGVNISMRTRMTPIITGASALLNIGLNFWMIPAWSILGAGISTLIGYAALLWLGWWNAQQSFPVSYDWWRFAKICAVTVGFCALSLTIVPAASLIGIVIRGLLIMAFPFGLAAVGAVTAADRKRARSLLAMRKGKQPDPGIDVEVAAP
jgi:O-antigen/teichoic acid export membrane protein